MRRPSTLLVACIVLAALAGSALAVGAVPGPADGTVAGAAPTGVATTATPTPTGTPGSADDGTTVLRARYPTDDGTATETVLTAADVASVGPVERTRSGGYFLQVSLTEAGAESFVADLDRLGFTGSDGTTCDPESGTGRCLQTVVDGEVVYSAAVAPGLAREFRSGDFVAEPRLRLVTENESTARDLAAALGDDGAAPTTMDTTTAPETATPGDGSTDDGTDGEGTDGGSLPGFGALAALCALSALAVLRRRR